MAAETGRRVTRKYVYQGDPLAEPPAPELTVILDRHRGRPDALMPVLDEVQRHYGYLPRRALSDIAHQLGYPLSRVYGVATFYHLFTFTPPGRYLVRLCQGTACHVNGAAALLDQIEQALGIGEGETTADGLITLQTVACTGACSLAPVLLVNDRTHGRMTAPGALALLHDLRAAPTPVEEEHR